MIELRAIQARLDQKQHGEVAYDHASHGCPLDDSDLLCPVCDAEEISRLEEIADSKHRAQMADMNPDPYHYGPDQ